MIHGAIVGVSVVLMAVILFFMGWVFAHSTIATECQRLNAFYVGSTVYTCSASEQPK